MDIVLVVITIIIPIFLLNQNIELDIYAVPMFIILFIFFEFLNSRAHKLYIDLNENGKKEQLEPNKKQDKKILRYIIILIGTGISLYIVGELLGNCLEILCNFFGIPQFLIGSLLGFITSIPELMTFFESQQYNKEHKNEMFGVVEATNNLLTSNTLNLFIIQTIGILITSI